MIFNIMVNICCGDLVCGGLGCGVCVSGCGSVGQVVTVV